MIIETVNEHSFTEAFRQIRPDNFSYEGQKALYEYLDDLSEDIGTPIELDVIAISCEYSEYESFEELKEYYKHHFKDVESLRDYTTVLEIENTGRLIIQNF
jgi:inosine/xanthosine triphosphate pyrophosphatase family protein